MSLSRSSSWLSASPKLTLCGYTCWSKNWGKPHGVSISFLSSSRCTLSLLLSILSDQQEQINLLTSVFPPTLRHEDMEKRQPCTNHSINGDTFRCIFPINCSGLRTIVLSVRSDSEDVQPVCMFTKEGREESGRLVWSSLCKETKGGEDGLLLEAPSSKGRCPSSPSWWSQF